MVHGRQLFAVLTCALLVFCLWRGCHGVVLMGRCLFPCGGLRTSSAISAVIAHVVVRSVVDDGLVIDIMNVRDVHVIHRTVVIEGSVSPISALIVGPTVTEAVVNASVKANVRTLIAAIPRVGVVAPTPIAGRPEQASFRRHHPRNLDPKVAFISISPVAGRPQIAVSRGHRLGVHG